MKNHFGQMFEVLDQIPRESLALFAKALSNPFCAAAPDETEQDKPVLIPCHPKN